MLYCYLSVLFCGYESNLLRKIMEKFELIPKTNKQIHLTEARVKHVYISQKFRLYSPLNIKGEEGREEEEDGCIFKLLVSGYHRITNPSLLNMKGKEGREEKEDGYIFKFSSQRFFNIIKLPLKRLKTQTS